MSERRPRSPSEVPRSRAYRRFWDGPRQVGDGIERVMRHLNAPKAGVVESVFSDWERLVGDVVAAHTRPQRIANGVLFLEVDDPAWASEMEWLSEDLLERISAKADTLEITEIKVVLTR